MSAKMSFKITSTSPVALNSTCSIYLKMTWMDDSTSVVTVYRLTMKHKHFAEVILQ